MIRYTMQLLVDSSIVWLIEWLTDWQLEWKRGHSVFDAMRKASSEPRGKNESQDFSFTSRPLLTQMLYELDERLIKEHYKTYGV